MRTLIAAVTVAALATPTLAADWTGGYVGLGVGNTDVDAGSGLTGDDTSYGIHGGYDYDFGDFVVGGELEYDRADVSIGGGVANLDNVARLKFKGGYDFGPVLGYAVLGAARADSSLGNDTGLVYGVGVAYAVTEQFSISGELLRHDFDDFNNSGLDIEADSINLRASFRF